MTHYVELTYTPYDSDDAVTVWAEVGPIDGEVQLFWECNEHGRRECPIIVMVSEVTTVLARLVNGKLEKVTC